MYFVMRAQSMLCLVAPEARGTGVVLRPGAARALELCVLLQHRRFRDGREVLRREAWAEGGIEES